MLYLGILIGIGAAIAFLALGLFTLLGSFDSARSEVQRSLTVEQPGGAARLGAQLSLWVPALVVVLFSLLTGIEFFRVMFAAF